MTVTALTGENVNPLRRPRTLLACALLLIAATFRQSAF